MRLDLSLFGHPSLRFTDADGHTVTVSGAKRVGLLAALALVADGRPTPRDTVAALLWGEDDVSEARPTLRQLLSSVRRALGEPLIVTVPPDALRLCSDRVRCDVWAFHAALADDDVARACDLYAGPLLEGMDAEFGSAWQAWLSSERVRLSRLASDAQWKRAKALERDGRTRDAIQAARTAIDLDPWCERGVRELIRMLIRAGDRGEALVVYHRFSDRMEEEFGAVPSPETRDVVASL